MTDPRTAILVDCDTGIDDSLALLYACASPETEMVAVTCVGGNVGLDQVGANTRAVLDLGCRGDLEVALGRQEPIARPLTTTPETHGPLGLGYASLPPARTAASPLPAPEVIVDAVRSRPGELTLVTLGPLTNLAVAVLIEPRLPWLVRDLVMMVGAYRSAGNTAPTAEWNAASDPEALAVVLHAWSPEASGGAEGAPARPRALGLDVTERAKLLPEHLERLAQRAGCLADGSLSGDPHGRNPVVRFLDDALRFYMEFHSRFDGFYGAFVHDPLALAVALDPALARTEAVRVEVELGSRLTSGETVTDWRRSWGRPANVDVAVSVDAETFFDRFIERVGALARDTANVRT